MHRINFFEPSILATISAFPDKSRAFDAVTTTTMHSVVTHLRVKLPTATTLALALAGGLVAVAGHAAAESALDLGKVNAGTPLSGGGFGSPVDGATLLATAASAPPAAPGFQPVAIAPGTPQPGAAASVAALVAPVRVAVAQEGGSRPAGLHATVSLTLAATSMNDSAGHALPLPAPSGVVSVSYSIR